LHSLVASAARGRLIATGSFPVLSTVAALVGIAAMIYGVVAGNRLAAGGPYRYRADLATRATSGSAQLLAELVNA